MASFSIKSQQSTLNGPFGYVFDLAAPYTNSKRVGGLASSAHAFINTAIACTLVGMDEPATKLLRKSEEWLIEAIASNERPTRYFSNASEADRLYDLSLCRWLNEARHDRAALAESIKYRETYFTESKKINTVGFILIIPEYLDAGASEQLSRRIAQLWTRSKRPFEVQVANQVLDGTAFDAASPLDDFYKQRISTWLNNGHFIDAAKWLKIGRWMTNQRRKPFDVMRDAVKYT